jgi:cell wall-associated NlpC family hydrolase
MVLSPRRLRLGALGLALTVLTSALVPLVAGADSITQTEAQIASLSAELSAQTKQSEITANAYDADKAELGVITANITQLQGQEAAKRAQIAQTASAMQNAAVLAYVLGASDAQFLSLFHQHVTSSDARQVYQDEVIGNLTSLKDQYVAQRQALDTTISQVAVQQADARSKTDEMSSLLDNELALESQTRKTLSVLTTKYRAQVIAYEITVGIAAAKAHNLDAETQAINAASAVGGQSAANQVTEAIQSAMTTITIGEVAGSAQGLLAVRYAESQIGVPYVWGGETPGVGFDCSGLVQWAWGKSGFTIPRTTETQWPALKHVPLSALQPGDLLFYYNLDGDDQVDHVVMYVGSGPWGTDTIIAAARTGVPVALAPIFTSGLIGAARP